MNIDITSAVFTLTIQYEGASDADVHWRTAISWLSAALYTEEYLHIPDWHENKLKWEHSTFATSSWTFDRNYFSYLTSWSVIFLSLLLSLVQSIHNFSWSDGDEITKWSDANRIEIIQARHSMYFVILLGLILHFPKAFNRLDCGS